MGIPLFDSRNDAKMGVLLDKSQVLPSLWKYCLVTVWVIKVEGVKVNIHNGCFVDRFPNL